MLNQKDARKVRPEILDEIVSALCATFPDKYTPDMFLTTAEGKGFQLPQDPDGDTFGVVKVVIKKDAEYDLIDAHDEFTEKEAERVEKAAKAAEAKAKKIKRDKEIRDKKAAKKAEAGTADGGNGGA